MVNIMAIQAATDRTEFTASELRAGCSVEDRIAIADDPRTSFKILQHLSKDASMDLRFALAENHNIDARILMTLTGDINPFVAHRATKTLARVYPRVSSSTKKITDS
jgi:hypothetical protein